MSRGGELRVQQESVLARWQQEETPVELVVLNGDEEVTDRAVGLSQHVLREAGFLDRQVLVSQVQGQVPLRVEVDHADTGAGLREGLGETRADRALAHPALLVAHDEPTNMIRADQRRHRVGVEP